MKIERIFNPKGFGGRQGFPSTPPVWGLSGTTTLPQTTVFDPLLYIY